MIHSKRNTLSSVAVDKASGALMDGLSKLQKEQQELTKKEELKKQKEQKERLEIEEWQRKHPGKPPWLRAYPEKDWDFYQKIESGELVEVEEEKE